MPKRKTHEEFIQEVSNLVNNEYTVFGTYKNAHTDLIFKHNNKFCEEHEFPMRPNAFLNGQRCPKCALEIKRQKKAFSNEYFQEKLENEFNGEFLTFDNYYNTNTTMRFIHTKCGRPFETTPKSLFKNRNCHKCINEQCIAKRTRTHEQFEQEVFNTVGHEYSVISEYLKSGIHVTIRHNNFTCDNHEYKVTPENFLYGYRCPKCNNPSRGEQKISQYLTINNILNESQYKFDDCVYKNRLPFDFATFNSVGEIILLIEYDGEQHFKPVRFGGISEIKAKQNLEMTIQNDRIKNNYCKLSSIPLLRIPYWEFNNIEDILKANLSILMTEQKESILL